MEIQIGEYKLRSWRIDDVPALEKYANNRKLWINLDESFPHPYTRKDAEFWVGDNQKIQPGLNLAIANEKEALGAIGVHPEQKLRWRSAEMGYWLGEPFWNKGIATSAVKAVSKYVFSNMEIIRLQACVFDWNPASARVLEKAGFILEGRLRKSITKDGKTIDQLIYGLVREGVQ